MKLNVGCGEFYARGWTNMDAVRNQQVRPDIVGSLTRLPDEVAAVEQVYLGHVLEHLPYIEVPAALRGLWARCAPGARVGVVGPDCQRAQALHARGAIDSATLEGARSGDRRWPGDAHLWECNEADLVGLLCASGLEARPVPVSSGELDGFPVVSRAPWQCAAVGVV